MNCEQFLICVRDLKQETKVIRLNKKATKRKRKELPKEEKITTYINYPCKDEARMNCCVSFFDFRSKPSCTEKGKTYTLDHSETNLEVLCMHIDGGVVAEKDTLRCDYAFFIKDMVDQGCGRAVFIELKGGGTEKALKQLIATLNMPEIFELSKDYRRIYGRIINTSSVPKIQSTGLYMDLKERLKKLGGNLKTGEWDFVEYYSELDD